MSHGLRWVIDIDIEKYFDSISHSHLRDFLDRQVTDGVIRRMIDKWLKAGVLEDGLLRHATEGSPQGGVISPCLSNIFLHHVLDEWFENEVRPRLKGRCTLVRFADDAVMAFETYHDAKRVLDVLGKRLARYGLTLHPDKTRFVDFRITDQMGQHHPETDGTTFTFLGFCHVWGKSRKGKNVVRQVTAKNRYARALAAVTEWCRNNRHQPIPDAARPSERDDAGPLCLLRHIGQLSTTELVRHQVARIWQKWLSRRDRQPAPSGVASPHSSRAILCQQPGSSIATPARERSSPVKNRKREICTSGSVRGGDGNILTYSAQGFRRTIATPVGTTGDLPLYPKQRTCARGSSAIPFSARTGVRVPLDHLVSSGDGSNAAKPSDFCRLHTKKAEVLSISQ